MGVACSRCQRSIETDDRCRWRSPSLFSFGPARRGPTASQPCCAMTQRASRSDDVYGSSPSVVSASTCPHQLRTTRQGSGRIDRGQPFAITWTCSAVGAVRADPVYGWPMDVGAVLPHNEIGSDVGAIKAYL